MLHPLYATFHFQENSVTERKTKANET